MKTFKQLLIQLDACKEAIEWAEDKTIEQVVKECHRGDWLLWLAQKVDIGLQPLTLAKAHCANTVRHLMKDERSINAIDIAIAFGEGRASINDLNRAAADASAADASAADAAAVNDSFAAAYSSFAAASALDDKGKKENQMLTADICRKYIGDLIIEKVNEKL